MYILGINAYHGDASATIIKDGKLIAAAEEERFNRFKHCAGFPALAIKYCLATAGIGIGEEVQPFGLSDSALSEVGLMKQALNTRPCPGCTARTRSPGCWW